MKDEFNRLVKHALLGLIVFFIISIILSLIGLCTAIYLKNSLNYLSGSAYYINQIEIFVLGVTDNYITFVISESACTGVLIYLKFRQKETISSITHKYIFLGFSMFFLSLLIFNCLDLNYIMTYFEPVLQILDNWVSRPSAIINLFKTFPPMTIYFAISYFISAIISIIGLIYAYFWVKRKGSLNHINKSLKSQSNLFHNSNSITWLFKKNKIN